MNLHEEINRRRTFAIISHPDAGKTTLTEKFLLYGGAIREAGSVKSRRANKHAVSDWMEIEKQRGISVTSSVLQFEYDGYCINILDTPGHQDFSEDTYRTLMAADSAVMVIDSAKGVEAQTKKLFKVCKMRGIPIFTFINKLDRSGKEPLELLEDIEKALGIKSYAMNWPIGNSKNFKGVFNRIEKKFEIFDGGNHGQAVTKTISGDITDEKFKEILGEDIHSEIIEELELLDMAGDEYNLDDIVKGELTPVFFGSALTNFGVEPFLKSFLEISTPPIPRNSNIGEVSPTGEEFSGFIFKIQANMNPQHRDRIAFLRICSGEFTKGVTAYHVQRNKKIKISQPQQFMAQEFKTVETAYAGDIIGIHDPGIFSIGDTISKANPKLIYDSIPQFEPEHFAKISAKNSMKRKQFLKGINQLSEEGSIQVFKRPFSGAEELIIGVVGALQFEVLEYRLKNEYGVDLIIQRLSYRLIKKLEGMSFESIKTPMDSMLAITSKEETVFIYQNPWSINHLKDRNKDIIVKEIFEK